MVDMRLKAQSAMEYLMTYGWAILIIAVALSALVSINVFGGSTLLPTSCKASPGFYCGKLTYSHTTGNVVFTFSQNTGVIWKGWAIMYAPQGTQMTANAANVLFVDQADNFYSSQPTQITLPAGAGTNVVVGTQASGDIWVCYSTTTNDITPGNILNNMQGSCITTYSTNTVNYAKIGNLNAKAS